MANSYEQVVTTRIKKKDGIDYRVPATDAFGNSNFVSYREAGGDYRNFMNDASVKEQMQFLKVLLGKLRNAGMDGHYKKVHSKNNSLLAEAYNMENNIVLDANVDSAIDKDTGFPFARAADISHLVGGSGSIVTNPNTSRGEGGNPYQAFRDYR